jgi:hypothetical protein
MKIVIFYWAWWYTPVIPELKRWRQEDREFEASLAYLVSSRPA